MRVPGVELSFVDVRPNIAAYRRMVRALEFDVCELAPTTYLVAKSFGAPFTALPVFLNRMWHFGDIQCRADAGIAEPRDLAGRRVGVRAYTVTTGVWVRGILRHEFGVDHRTITWVTDDEEHVEQFRPPPNVVAAPPGRSLQALLASGDIDAAFGGNAGIGRAGPPRAGWADGGVETAVRPLFPDAARRDREWHERTGIVPIHGLVVVKDALLAADPTLAGRLYDAFIAARDAAPLAEPRPYGLEANHASIDALIAFSYEQGLIPERVRMEDVFAGVGA